MWYVSLFEFINCNYFNDIKSMKIIFKKTIYGFELSS